MAHYLNAGDLAELCSNLGYPEQAKAIEAAMDAAAYTIARHFPGVAVTSPADNEGEAFGGLLVGFGPGADAPDTPCPEEMVEYDLGSDWSEGRA